MLVTFQWSFEMKRERIEKNLTNDLTPPRVPVRSCQRLNFCAAIAGRQNTFVVVFYSDFKLSV